MKQLLLLLFVGLFFTSCKMLPPQPLHVETSVRKHPSITLEQQYDTDYTLEYHIMNKAQHDYVSIILSTMLYQYRFDFKANGSFRSILDKFFKVSDISSRSGKKNGMEYLGDAAPYTYIMTDNSIVRAAINGTKMNHAGFSFLLKDGEKFLTLDMLSISSIDTSVSVKNVHGSVPIKYDDIKRLYDFLTNIKEIESIRQKKLHVLNVYPEASSRIQVSPVIEEKNEPDNGSSIIDETIFRTEPEQK